MVANPTSDPIIPQTVFCCLNNVFRRRNMPISVIPAVLIIVLLNVIGDYFLKTSADKSISFLTYEAVVGALLYAISAYGWIYVMQKVNLTVVGMLYSTMTIVILTIMSIVIFKEEVTKGQLLSAALAVVAVLIPFFERYDTK